MDDIYSKISDDTEFGVDFDKNEKSQIQEFFADQIIFLTGCTGFLGKCIVEKLLRGCPRLKKLYLMVRPLKEPVSERAKKYFEHEVFRELRSLIPNFESKVSFIGGNLMEEDLGIPADKRSIIINTATMIIHNASNVKFDIEVSQILRTNVYGTLYLLNLARDCKNLKLFTYVSTAYSHSYQKSIEEKCYSPPGDLKLIKDFIDADEACPGSFTAERRYKAVKPWPNIYAFSKATAESLVEELAKKVPFRCLIYRPTIVVSTYKEPISAWCGNANGPVVGVLGLATGIVHAFYKGIYTIDVVPADMCTNALLAIMWDSVVNRLEQNHVLVYNYGSSTVKPMNFYQFEEVIRPRAYELPPSKRSMRPYNFTGINCIYCYYIVHLFVHFIPAVLADIYFLITRFRKPMYFALAMKVSKQLEHLWFFMNGNWRIHVHETRKMWNRMGDIDKHLFYNDLRTLSWEDYGYNYYAGIKQWILKEPNDGSFNHHLKSFAIALKIYRAVVIISYIALGLLSWYCFSDWIFFLLSPFINLGRLMFFRF